MKMERILKILLDIFSIMAQVIVNIVLFGICLGLICIGIPKTIHKVESEKHETD